VLQMPDKTVVEVPCGMVVWAAVRAANETFCYQQYLSAVGVGKQGKTSYSGFDGEAAICPDK
jgi:hypothetical protein